MIIACTRCGAEADAACECGKPYEPASQRAAEAVKANPGKSDRVIAAEIGVGSNTVRRARKSVAPRGAPETVTGRDGKNYKAKPRRPSVRQMRLMGQAAGVVAAKFDEHVLALDRATRGGYGHLIEKTAVPPDDYLRLSSALREIADALIKVDGDKSVTADQPIMAVA